MKKVKLFSIILAITMIAMPAQMAFAGVEEVTGDGKVYYVDPSSRINVVLPTSASLGFTLDPQNLAAIQGVGEWKPEDGGSIIPHAVGILVNQSAVPVSATVQFTLDDDAGDIVLLDSPEDVNDGTDKNMYISFVPANAKTTIAKDAIAELEAPEYVQDEGALQYLPKQIFWQMVLSLQTCLIMKMRKLLHSVNLLKYQMRKAKMSIIK